ncbi:MAG: hypothetical protein KDB27_02025 [Planctomycetales bacterium]|nr:hypothetical protein [Planctomycetales bacterium]
MHLDFERVKREIGIPQIFEKFGIEFRERNGRIRIACPLPDHRHNEIKPNTEGFVADCRKGTWQWVCFSAEDHNVSKPLGGSVIELVMRLAKLESYKHVRLWFLDAFPELGESKPPNQQRRTERDAEPKEKASEDAHQDNHSPARRVNLNLLDLNPPLKPLSWFYNVDQSCRYLLDDRGFTPETIERFGFGLVTRPNTFLSGYVAIPVFLPGQGESENPVAYLGRYAGELNPWPTETPRYRFWKNFPRNEVVFGLRDALRDTGADAPLVVTEGPLSAAMIAQKTGLRSVVATFGAFLSERQSQILRATERDIIWLWDGGTEQATNLALGILCQEFVRVRAINLPHGTNPDELSEGDLLSLLSLREVCHAG